MARKLVCEKATRSSLDTESLRLANPYVCTTVLCIFLFCMSVSSGPVEAEVRNSDIWSSQNNGDSAAIIGSQSQINNIVLSKGISE